MTQGPGGPLDSEPDRPKAVTWAGELLTQAPVTELLMCPGIRMRTILQWAYEAQVVVYSSFPLVMGIEISASSLVSACYTEGNTPSYKLIL